MRKTLAYFFFMASIFQSYEIMNIITDCECYQLYVFDNTERDEKMFEDVRVTTKSEWTFKLKKCLQLHQPITLQQSHEIYKKRHMCKINTNIQLKEQFIQKCFVNYVQLHSKTASQRCPKQLKQLETRLKTEKTNKDKH